MFFYGSSFIAMKIALTAYNPMTVILGRMLLATIVFIPFFLTRFKNIRIQKEDYKWMLFMALCEPCLYFLFEGYALNNTTASQAGIISAILPLMIAFTARFVLLERLKRSTIIGFIIAVIGAAVLSFSGEVSATAPHPLLGNFLEFMAMGCATGGIITTKYLTAKYPPFFLTAIQAVIGCVFFIPLFFMTAGNFNLDLSNATMAILYLGLFVTIMAYGLYNFGMSKIPASKASAYINLIPAFTILFGSLLLHERFTLIQLLSCGVVFIGVFLSQKK